MVIANNGERNQHKIGTKHMNLEIVYSSLTTNLHSYVPYNLHCTSKNILYVFWYTNLCGSMGLGDSRVKHLNVTKQIWTITARSLVVWDKYEFSRW